MNKDKQLKETQFQSELRQQKKWRNFLIIASVLLSLLIFVIIISYRQKIKSNALLAIKNEEISKQQANITGQIEERKRIAKELHDGIGGTLACIKLSLISIDSSSTNKLNLTPVITNVDNACKEIRTISHNLSSPAFTNLNFIDILKELAEKFSVPDKIEINFNFFPENELNQLPESIKETIHRIVQELLHNITKHANASNVEIGLSLQENVIHLLVEDNGKGFDSTKMNNGIGLNNITERVKKLKGNIIIDSKLDRGTAITIEIPLNILV